MVARVDPSLQLVKSDLVIALHSSTLGDIVDSQRQVGSCQIISFCRWSTSHVSSECWRYLRNGHEKSIPMNLDDAAGGDIEPQQYWFETELTQVRVTNSQPHRTPPHAGGRFFLSSLQSPQWGLILRHCELCLRSGLPAADYEGRSS